MAVKARDDITLSRVDDGAKGDTGNGIASVVYYYAISDSNTTAPSTWTKNEAIPPTEGQPYLWGYNKTTYTDGTTAETEKHVMGVRGDNGDITEFKQIAQDMIDDASKDLQDQIKQESDTINQTISDKNAALADSMMTQLDNYKAEVGQYMRHGDSGLELGATDSAFKTIIDNQGMYFKDGDTTVAYAKNNQFNMPNAVVEKSLKIGKFIFVPHSNGDGGMSLIWTGG